MSKLQAGRETDVLVAEQVMGWTDLHWVGGKTEWNAHDCRQITPEGWYGKGPDGECYLTKGYSTDIRAAWEVVEKLTDDGVTTINLSQSIKPRGWWCEIKWRSGSSVRVWAGTAPLAICRAAPEAVAK